jgi:glycyl-tRNA synthetase beta subunit
MRTNKMDNFICKFISEAQNTKYKLMEKMPFINVDLLESDIEKDLCVKLLLIKVTPFDWNNVDSVKQRLNSLAETKEYIDAFFENVRIEADSPALTQNRKNILRFFTCLLDDVVDFSKLKHG